MVFNNFYLVSILNKVNEKNFINFYENVFLWFKAVINFVFEKINNKNKINV